MSQRKVDGARGAEVTYGFPFSPGAESADKLLRWAADYRRQAAGGGAGGVDAQMEVDPQQPEPQPPQPPPEPAQEPPPQLEPVPVPEPAQWGTHDSDEVEATVERGELLPLAGKQHPALNAH
jgi:hypothetical protein